MAAPVVPTYLVADLAADVRRDSDLNSSQIYSDDDIATLISDAGSSLRDVFTGANQHYDVSTFAFTLVGGVGQNAVNLPADFQQGHSVDVNPGTSQPYTLRYLSNWLDRNRLNLAPFSAWGPGGGPREYYFLGSNPGQLIVLPAMGAAGSFLLYYTPMWMPLAIPAPIPPAVPTVPATINAIGTGGGGLSAVSFNGAAWTQASVGGSLVIANSANGNNGSYPIARVADNADITVTGTLVAESGTGVTATVQPAGTRPDLPANMNPWVLYLKTMACITIRNKRGQDVEAFMARLAVDQQRIEKILQERQEEGCQPPLTRNSGFFGGGW